VDDDWSDCIYTCKDNVNPPQSNCDWVAPSTCQKEFDYEGIHYVGCTAIDHDTPWCSLSHPFNGSWKHCNYECASATEKDQLTKQSISVEVANDNNLCSWVPPEICSDTFFYTPEGGESTMYTGCAMWVDHPTPWCSHHSKHAGQWSKCDRVCTEVS
jgi:hypothetical protein